MSKYPESEKVYKERDKLQIVGEFIEWLGNKGYTISGWGQPSEAVSHGLVPVRKTIDQWLYEFFKINMNSYEQEKKQMIKELQENKT